MSLAVKKFHETMNIIHLEDDAKTLKNFIGYCRLIDWQYILEQLIKVNEQN